MEIISEKEFAKYRNNSLFCLPVHGHFNLKTGELYFSDESKKHFNKISPYLLKCVGESIRFHGLTVEVFDEFNAISFPTRSSHHHAHSIEYIEYSIWKLNALSKTIMKMIVLPNLSHEVSPGKWKSIKLKFMKTFKSSQFLLVE